MISNSSKTIRSGSDLAVVKSSEINGRDGVDQKILKENLKYELEYNINLIERLEELKETYANSPSTLTTVRLKYFYLN